MYLAAAYYIRLKKNIFFSVFSNTTNVQALKIDLP